MIFVVGLVYFSYSLCFWGGTLLNGGPGNTGSWPFLYTLTGLGPLPPQVQNQPGQTGGQPGGVGSTAISSGGPSSLGAAASNPAYPPAGAPAPSPFGATGGLSSLGAAVSNPAFQPHN